MNQVFWSQCSNQDGRNPRAFEVFLREAKNDECPQQKSMADLKAIVDERNKGAQIAFGLEAPLDSSERDSVELRIGEGTGTELVLLLANKLWQMIGVNLTTTCGCLGKAQEMNNKGPNWCEANAEPLIEYLRKVHKSQRIRIPFSRTVAKKLLFTAIKRARKRQVRRPTISKPLGENEDGLLTIGMACFDDFHGVVFTITALKWYHKAVADHCEFLVVDNNPHSEHGKATRRWCAGNGQTRYVPFDQPKGTAQARDEVFRQATSEFVLCMDCHVFFPPGTLDRLIEYLKRNRHTTDLLQGPLITERGKITGAYQRPAWGAGAFGKWTKDERACDVDAEPFEIWQQGMGVFCCRKDAWVHFHPDMRGFGGCETYIAEKFRARGSRVLCLPFFRWWHRFTNPDGRKDRVSDQDKARNYLIGFAELGYPLDGVLIHFKLTPEQALKLTGYHPQVVEVFTR